MQLNTRLTIDSLDELLQRADLHLYAGLSERVVILYPVQQLRGAPETVRLDRVQRLLG